ncbi:MAG: hypothetical protein OEY68_00825 [Gammaproteobacteria bacterium]|nr:hypothetical protein [Gammaproteobacteria bacterium]
MVSAITDKEIFAHPEKVNRWLSERQLSVQQIPNPHWHNDACQACHTKKNSASLRNNNTEQLCLNCHQAVSRHGFNHSSDKPTSDAMLKRMPANFRNALKTGNKATCTTCHELAIQCLPKQRKEKRRNPMFLRGGPYRYRSDPCYQCHDAKAYARINPHDQIDEAGNVRKSTCRLCHSDKNDLDKARNISEVGFNVEKDLKNMCTGCHPWIPHPGGTFMFTGGERPEHLAKPSKWVLQRMQESEKKLDIILPLDPTNGEVFCGTCHNPHERNLLSSPVANKGADSKKRLRLQEICTACHEK